MLSAVLSGIFVVVAAYAMVSAFHGLAPGLAKSDAPLTQIASSIGLDWVGNLIAAGVAMSCFACTVACVNAGARVLYALSRHGLMHASTARTHASHATPHTATTIVAIVALAFSLCLSVFKVGLVEAFGDFGTLASFGFLVAYMLVSIGTPFYLKRIGALRFRHVVISAASVALILVAFEGSLYPIPDWPLWIISYAFLVLVGIRVGYFLYLKSRAPDQLQAIEVDLMANN